LSGPEALAILRKLIADEAYDPEPNLLVLRSLFDPASSQQLDESLVCYFKAPHTFTGEDVVEFQCHGSPIVIRTIIDAALLLGARMADAGEFSLRAVANGRMTLTEAEAIRDLISAHTDAAVRQATRQMKGEISNRLQPAKDHLLEIIVRLESSLEFVEDDLPATDQQSMLNSLEQLVTDLEKLARTFNQGKLIRDGLRVTLVGRPNVGKSSIFNMLLGHGRAIVTDLPGTTRDTITEYLNLNGVPIVLTDTAGIRSAGDQIEAIGVDRTKREAADSDLLIVVLDGSEPLNDEDQKVLNEVTGRRHLIAINKSDLPKDANASVADSDIAVVSVSAKTEAGLEMLRTAILEPFTNGSANSEGLLITNARHHDLLLRSIEATRSSAVLLQKRASEEVVLVGLHNTLRYLGEITGETTSDEILGEIFATFCIGK
jgi:tRNA modification GTPase